VVPKYAFTDAPPIDILLVPGGFGTRPLLEDAETLDWIRATAAHARLTTSVCTGALLLAKAGLLENKRATTHWAALDLLAAVQTEERVERGVRFVDAGSIITSAGVAAGIDMALHVVQRICGPEVADETARYIDTPRRR
jgi:transcriptional regulator GlxA family with amidase domain